MTVPSACTRSAVRCGREVCPPGEVRRSSSMSQAEVIGPTRVPTWPTSRRGSQCSAKMRSTSSRPFAAMTSSAPPGWTSSAGWKTSRTRPGSRSATEASARPAPSSTEVCASCPHMCATPGTCETHGTSVCSCSGRASMSARSATVRGPEPMSQISPVPGSRRGSRPADSSTRAQQGGGRVLGAGELGVRVDRASPARRRRPRARRARRRATAGRCRCPRSVTPCTCVAPESSGRVCSSVTVPPPCAAERDRPVAGVTQDASVGGAPGGHGRRWRRGVRTMLSVAGMPAARTRRAAGPRRSPGNGPQTPVDDRRAVARAVTDRRRSGCARPVSGGQGRTGGATVTGDGDAIMDGVSPRPAETRRLVGRYRLDSELGRGAMGTVWSAYDEVLHRPVAVKEVRLSLVPVSERAIVRERTLREARATAMLSHPNVVTLYDVVEVDSEPYVVMELLPSRSLASYIAERGTLSQGETAEIGSAVASALMTAHRAGITHRDVKPGNVLIGTRRADQAHRLRHRPQRRRVVHDPDRHRARVAALHRARGGDGARGRAARGPVGPRRDALRLPGGPPALRRGRPGLDGVGGRPRRHPAAVGSRARGRRRPRAHGEGPRPAHAAARGAPAPAPAHGGPRGPDALRAARPRDDGVPPPADPVAPPRTRPAPG